MVQSARLPAVAVALLLGGCGYTSAPSRPAVSPVAEVAVSASVSLSSEQAGLVRSYYGASASGNGRGRGNRDRLPPGIERNLSRGKALPPGIAKERLPAHISNRLPSLPEGLEYLLVAGKLLLVEAATDVIRQVLIEAVT